MFRVTSDPERNRLYITLAGHIEGPERQEAMKALIAETAKLSEGFGVVSDISALHASNEEGFKDLLRVKAALKLKGAGPIVRVVKIPLSRIQFERITEAAGYRAEETHSLEEADRRLDELQAGTKP
ncbi:MAG: hypothetical protein WAS25_01785 [Geothrix sp.]|uniref:hypothetical protein n=1 Tax=Geothrix sp. TaxID=1962974 RepID=UPI003BAE385E